MLRASRTSRAHIQAQEAYGCKRSMSGDDWTMNLTEHYCAVWNDRYYALPDHPDVIPRSCDTLRPGADTQTETASRADRKITRVS